MESDVTPPPSVPQPASMQTPLAGGYVELLAIAVPMVLSSSTQSLMHVVDRVFMTWYSKEAVAAALPAGILFWSCLSLPFGIVSYANAFVAQYDGAKQPARVAAAVWQAAYFALACGLLLIPCAWFSDALFDLVGHEDSVRKLEAEYFSWLCLGAVFALLPAALSTFYSGRGQTRMVLLVNGASVMVNAVLVVILVFGWGPIPKLGMTGAAIATNLANAFATLCYVFLLTRSDARDTYEFWKHWRFDRRLMRDLL